MTNNLNHFLQHPLQSIYHSLQWTATKGMQVSKSLDPLKLLSKGAITALKVTEKVVPYFACLALIPFGTLYSPLKDVKRICNFFLAFRSFDFYLNKGAKGPWVIQVLNIAGLGLFVFTVIDLLERFKFDVSAIHNIAKKVPLFGVLPFAGLLNLCTLTLYGSIYLLGLEKKEKLNEEEERISNKINLWQTKRERQIHIVRKAYHYNNSNFDQLSTQERIRQEAKRASWNALRNCNEPHQNPAFFQRKVNKWELKLEKLSVEKRSNELALVSGSTKILSTLISSAALLSGVGIPLALTISLGLNVIEAACDGRNYFLKKQVPHYRFDSVLFTPN